MSIFAHLRAAFGRRAPLGPYERGIVALQEGRAQAACGHFTAAVHQANGELERALAHNKRGVAFVEIGRREEALRDFVEALCCVGCFAPAIVNIGNLLFEDGDTLEAIEHYRAALRYDEKNALAHLNLGVAYKRLGKRSEAVRHLRAAGRLEGGANLGRGLRSIE